MSKFKEIEFQEMLLGEKISYGIVQPGVDQVNSGVPIIRVNNIKNGRISTDEVMRVASEIESKHSKTRLEGGELLITVVGNPGECAIAPDFVKGWNVARAVSVARIKSDYVANFIKYAFRNEDIRYQLYGNTNDTVQPTINLSELKKIRFIVPEYREQQAIAEVLSSLDDKIDLLHRNNKTLEEMAETLFRQWFVEGAKEDWAEYPLDSIAEYLNGLALQKFPAISGQPSIPAIKIREMNQGITDSSDQVSVNIPEKYIIRNGDILFSWSGSLDVIIWSGGIGALNQHLFKVIPKSFPQWLVYLTTKHFLPEFREIAQDKATTMGHIQRHHLSEAILKLPGQELIDKCDKKMSPIFSKLIKNSEQISQLKFLRDSLLPKLMSGQVRVNL